MNVSNSAETGNAILAQLNGQYDGTLDVPTVVESLLYSETGIQLNSLNKDIDEAVLKQSAFELLDSSLNGFSSIMTQISKATQNIEKSAVILDPSIATVSVADTVLEGSYAFEVLNMASKQSTLSGTYAGSTSLVGSGTMVIETGSYGGSFAGNGNAISVTVTAGTTVEQLVAQINGSGSGVQAYMVNTSSGVQIALSSKETGTSNGYAVTITDSDGSDSDLNGLSSLQYNDVNKNVSLAQSASDAQVLFDGVLLTSTSNSFNNVIDGFDIDVTSVNVGSPTIINVGNDVDGAKDLLVEFIDNYNSVIQVFDYLSSVEEGENSEGALFRDRDFKMLEDSFRSIATEYVAGYGGTAHLNALGVQFSKDDPYQLELDDAIFDKQMAIDPNSVSNALTQVGTATNPNVTLVSAETYTKEGFYTPITVTTLAQTAKVSGGAATALLIDGTNDEFSITVNGESTGSLFLQNKAYVDYNEMAQEIQNQINGALVASTVTVSFNGTGFDIDNGDIGSASTFIFDTVEAGFATTTGISAGLTGTGVDIAGSVGGEVAIGTGNVLDVLTGDPAGMKILVNATVLGNYGDLDFSDGIAKKLSDYVIDNKSVDGLFTGILEKYSDSISEKEETVTKLESRTDELRVRYSMQYSMINNFIIAMQMTGKQLQAQFDAWNSAD